MPWMLLFYVHEEMGVEYGFTMVPPQFCGCWNNFFANTYEFLPVQKCTAGVRIDFFRRCTAFILIVASMQCCGGGGTIISVMPLLPSQPIVNLDVLMSVWVNVEA